MSHTTLAIIFSVVAILGLLLFLFIMTGLVRFGRFTVGSKILTPFLAIVSLSAMSLGGRFAYKNFMYKPPVQDELTQKLQEEMTSVQQKETNNTSYKQVGSFSDRTTKPVDELMNLWNDKGRVELQALLGSSDKNKEFFLRNVGDIKTTENNATTKIKSISGKVIDLTDKTNRILFFADNTEFTTKQLLLFKEVKPNAELVVLFPTLNGTQVNEYLSANQSVKDIPMEIVTIDSYPSQANQSLKLLAMEEYRVKYLPAIIAIDSTSIISNVSVGGVLTSTSDVNIWLEKAFSKDISSRYYWNLKQN